MALAVAGAADAQAPVREPGEIFNGIAGSCWKAEIGNGSSDTHCFTMAGSGKLVMDVHKVRNAAGAVVYEGVTTYRVEASSGAIRYEYFNSLGDLLPGYARRVDERLVFSPEPNGTADVVWYLGTDAYEVGSPVETAARTKFVKSGPAAGDGL
jgi:hypothetical protein